MMIYSVARVYTMQQKYVKY